MKLVGLLAMGLMTSGAYAQSQPEITEAWKGFSAPEIMLSGFINQMSLLPVNGTMEIGTKAWSGHYWPSKKAGITNRWNSPRNETFDYKSPDRVTIENMSMDELAILSPAEKLDLYNGEYHYPFKAQAAKNSNRLASDWAGICHGWAPASVHHNEPTPKVMTNADGLQIPFGSADIKALVSYYYAFYDENPSRQLGLRCFFGSWMGGARGCDQDLNAGAFHIVISNKLGLQGEGLMMDKERFREVWNQPVISYNVKILNDNLSPTRNAASSTVKEMRISMELYYVDESLPNWNVVHGTKDQLVEKMDLQYRIELNSEGKIVGGEWESKSRPDFLWFKPKVTEFSGHLKNLNDLLDD